MSVLKVGFFDDVTTTTYGYESIPTSVAQAARGIEEGSWNNAPERPFMNYTWKKGRVDWVKFVRNELSKKTKKDTDVTKAIESIYKDLGYKVKQSIQESMTEASEFNAIAPATEKARRDNGIDSDNPFIATGGLYNSVEVRIE